jgi:hypothetical protein
MVRREPAQILKSWGRSIMAVTNWVTFSVLMGAIIFVGPGCITTPDAEVDDDTEEVNDDTEEVNDADVAGTGIDEAAEDVADLPQDSEKIGKSKQPLSPSIFLPIRPVPLPILRHIPTRFPEPLLPHPHPGLELPHFHPCMPPHSWCA